MDNPMNLVPNAGTVAVKSWAVWVGYAAAGCLAIAGALSTAPDSVQQLVHLPTTGPILKWMAGVLAGPGVQAARVLQQVW